MREKSSKQKTSQQSKPAAGPDGVTIAPPVYGVNVQRKPAPETGHHAPGGLSPHRTGLSDALKSGIESLSGLAMDDVHVHTNSSKPAQLQALAYTQGTDIHVAPGQERHLPHEAWHVVQQKQGRVKPTFQMKGGVNVNDDAGLEKEADVIGAKAMQFKAPTTEKTGSLSAPKMPTDLAPLQRKVNVYAKKRKGSVVITATGNASKFQGGSYAKNKGWNGVEKYKAAVKVGDNDTIYLGETNNNYLVAQAGHVLAEQNGGNGGDPDNVFAQDGGVNNGPFRKNFENPMRAQLDEADKKDKVHFRVVLYGENITKGPLEKESDMLDASEEETDFEDFSSD